MPIEWGEAGGKADLRRTNLNQKQNARQSSNCTSTMDGKRNKNARHAVRQTARTSIKAYFRRRPDAEGDIKDSSIRTASPVPVLDPGGNQIDWNHAGCGLGAKTSANAIVGSDASRGLSRPVGNGGLWEVAGTDCASSIGGTTHSRLHVPPPRDVCHNLCFII